MEVLSSSKAYIDGAKVAHSGVLLCKKSLDTETWSFNLPDLDGTSKLEFVEEDVKKIFFYPEKNIAGFLFTSNMKQKSFIMEMAVEFPYDEFKYFKEINSQMFPDKSSFVTTLHNQKEAKRYVTSNLHRGSEVWRMVFSLGMIKGSGITINSYESMVLSMEEDDAERGRSIPTGFRMFRPYLRCYTKFLLVNQVNEKEAKRIIREIDDFPHFMKFYSGSLNVLQPLLYMFLLLHACTNPGCKKFGYLKCQECRLRHYCGRECQVEHWDYHRNDCQAAQVDRDMTYLIPKLIQTEIESICGNELLTFEVFFKELSYKLFEALHDSLKTPAFSFLFRENSEFASRDISQLIRKRGIKSQTWQSFRKQYFEACGKEWNSKPLDEMFLYQATK